MSIFCKTRRSATTVIRPEGARLTAAGQFML